MGNPLKTSLLKFIRYFYDENLRYADEAIEKWIKSYVVFVCDILINGIIFWLVLLSLTSIFPISWINLGPNAWHFLNILQLGLILWFIEGIYKFMRGGYKK